MSKYAEKKSSKLLGRFLSNWYWFALSLAIAIAAAWYMLAKQPYMWRVIGSIVVEEDKSQSGGQMPQESIMQGLPFKNMGTLDRQIQILRSRNLMEKVVDSLSLDFLYYHEGRFKDTELYKNSPFKVALVDKKEDAYGKILRVRQVDENRFYVLGEEKADTQLQSFRTPFTYQGVTIALERDSAVAASNDVILIAFVRPRDIAAWYSSQLVFQKQAQSNVLTVSMVEQTPAKIVDIIHKLVEVYNTTAQEDKNRMAARSLRFIDERLSNLSAELFSVETREATYRSGSGVTTDVSTSAELYLSKLSTAETSKAQITNMRNALTSLESFLTNPGSEYKLIPNVGDLAGISFAPLISNYNRFVAERERRLLTQTPKHPEVVSLQDAMASLRTNILSGIGVALDGLSQQEEQVTSTAAPLQRKVASLPFAAQKINEISREGSVKKELVLYMLQKREETAIGLAAHVESARVLDEPVAAGAPDSPNKKQYYMLAFVLGLALPASVIYALDRMNDKITGKTDVKELTMVPFLGEVAQAKSERTKLITSNSRSVISEMFRQIRTNLQFMLAGGKNKVILVTSTTSGDGKTFVSGNLAACLALMNKKTVILELDLRRPKLTELILKKPPTVGVTNYLVDEKSLDEIIQPIEGYEDLFLISAGPTPPNPAELISSEKMDKLFEELKERFDFIVLDTPPIGVVTDAFLLNRFSHCSIYVVRSGKTRRDDFDVLNDVNEQGRLAHPALILNGVKAPKRYGYYY